MTKFRNLLLLLFLFTFSALTAQTPCESIEFCETGDQLRLNELREEFSSNKIIPEEFELAALIALSYYPELKNENIEFMFSKGAYSMAARPAPMSLFGKRENRIYRVFINTQSHNNGLLLHQVPFNAQVGVIGHELAHVLYYTNKTTLGIIADGIGYASKKYRADFERATDQVTIDRGLGWQLLDFCSHTHDSDQVPEKYKAYKAKTYMTPDDIVQYIQRAGIEENDFQQVN